jgi:hypothetical protein
LINQKRNDYQHQYHQGDDRDQRDQRHSQHAACSLTLEPARDGIKAIGDCPAQNKRQNNIAQHPEHEKEHCRGEPPVFKLVLNWQCHNAWLLLFDPHIAERLRVFKSAAGFVPP